MITAYVPRPSNKRPKLKDCPFCGGKAVLINAKGMVRIHCEDCLVDTRTFVPRSVYDNTELNAIAAWNMRVNDDG